MSLDDALNILSPDTPLPDDADDAGTPIYDALDAPRVEARAAEVEVERQKMAAAYESIHLRKAVEMEPDKAKRVEWIKRAMELDPKGTTAWLDEHEVWAAEVRENAASATELESAEAGEPETTTSEGSEGNES